MKLPIFQLQTYGNGRVEKYSMERCDRADDLDTCSHSARDSAPRAEPIQI